MKKISFRLSTDSVERAVKELEDYRNWLKEKCIELCEKLAFLGATKATLDFSRVFYTGPKDVEVSVEKRGNGFAVIANGESVLFLEFGAGIKYGDGHPLNDQFGMGPGTWPDKHYRKGQNGKLIANWENPKGWWIPGGEHTYGNPPSRAMYNASQEMRHEIERIAKEVFGSDRH